MERLTHNKSETKAINDAWRALRELVESTNYGNAMRLRDAYKMEQGYWQNAPVSKAAICKAWAEGYEYPDMPARDLIGHRDGCVLAFIVGAIMATSENKTEEAKRVANLCILAHDARQSAFDHFFATVK